MASSPRRAHPVSCRLVICQALPQRAVRRGRFDVRASPRTPIVVLSHGSPSGYLGYFSRSGLGVTLEVLAPHRAAFSCSRFACCGLRPRLHPLSHSAPFWARTPALHFPPEIRRLPAAKQDDAPLTPTLLRSVLRVSLRSDVQVHTAYVTGACWRWAVRTEWAAKRFLASLHQQGTMA